MASKRSGLDRDARGASLVEYILMVGVVALVALLGFRVFGRTMLAKTSTEAQCVGTLSSGCSGSSSTTNAESAASAAPATVASSGSPPTGWQRFRASPGGRFGYGLVNQVWEDGKGLVTLAFATTPAGTAYYALRRQSNPAADAALTLGKLAVWATPPFQVVTAISGKDPIGDTGRAIGKSIANAFRRDGWEASGRGIAQVLEIAAPIAKARWATRAVELARAAEGTADVARLGDVGRAAEVAAAARTLGSDAAEAGAAAPMARELRGVGQLMSYPVEGTTGPQRVISLLGDDEKMRWLVGRLDLPPGTTTVVVHGTPGAFEVERGGTVMRISQRELANYIEANGGAGKGPVVLFSCATGDASYEWPIAQDLANRLGREVWAPTKNMTLEPFRNRWLKNAPPGRTIYRIGGPESDELGAWRRFVPRPPKYAGKR